MDSLAQTLQDEDTPAQCAFVERELAEAPRERLGALFVCGDMRAFASPPEFDAAICLFDAFGFHVDEDHALILDRCLAALRPGGRLLLDVRTRGQTPGAGGLRRRRWNGVVRVVATHAGDRRQAASEVR